LKTSDSVVQSPCIRNCCLNDDDICLGCFRTLEDIKNWGAASSAERLEILKNAQQRRAAAEKKDLKQGLF